ncbi:C-type lectin domain family 14 member A [Etheostoma cragini]|uniref:C-type lectin domain family 14 member A n=1 Tax=Etheostoma cragini TaxID=417921 RepID=UPI00155EBC09|nr:C-type lectin domain family 14 member A [Etheostoma cragini]
MKSWFCWILILFRDVLADPGPRYVVHRTPVSFDRAAELCSPTGLLTTLATEQEVTAVLEAAAGDKGDKGDKGDAGPPRGEFTFWVGLRKLKDECVIPTLPLRGFKWTKDGSEDSQVSRWFQEPKETCTSSRCAALKVQLDGSRATPWGLIPVSCRTENHFICQLTHDAHKATGPKADPEPGHGAHEPDTPSTKADAGPELGPDPGPNPGPDPGPDAAPDNGPSPGLYPGPDPGSQLQPATTEKSKTGATHQSDIKPRTTPTPGPDPSVGSGSCQPPHIPSARSISLGQVNSSRILVECWSSLAPLELRCWGRPVAWRLPDGSPADFSDICASCDAGFQKDASGTCVDVDECSSGPCRRGCLNTAGSYSCFCSDQSGNQHHEDSPECAEAATGGVLVVALVAVAALVLLVVVVLVTVKCCLMRQSKKRAMKKAEKMAMGEQGNSQ